MKLKKLKNRLLTLMAAVALTLSAAIPRAGASGVTYINIPDSSFSVSKTVESAVEGYPIPDDSFTFTLMLNGKPAANQEYTLLENGKEIPKTEIILGVEKEVPRKTDFRGRFTLKTDQKARFDAVSPGVEYTVTETPNKDYEIESPIGGSASGIMPSDGAQVSFHNRYIPTTPDSPGSTTLSVSKAALYPTGFALPAEEAQAEFTFRLTVMGEPYENQPYRIVNADESDGGTGQTGEGGIFTLRADQTAYFDEVEANGDYKVEELTDRMPEGWYQVSYSNAAGPLTAPLVSARFVNTNAAFAVSKVVKAETLTEEDLENEFTFVLSDKDGNPWQGAKYYLYTTGGERLTDENGDALPAKTTNGKGEFRLKSFEAALFVNIPTGTIYSVKELYTDSRYTQTLPASADGYVKEKVKSPIKTLPFENSKLDWEGSLVVLKTLKSIGSAPTVSRPFTFRLERLDLNDGSWVTCANHSYSMLGGTDQTTEEGTFTLYAGQTALFEGLLPNGQYRVTELADEMGFGEEGDYMEYSIDPEDAVQEATTDQTNTPRLEFVNTYDKSLFTLYITKTGEQGVPLSGAKFRIFRDEACTEVLKDGEEFTSRENGQVIIPQLKRGTYYLLETLAPAGYRLLGKPVKITIDESGASMNGTPVKLEQDSLHISVANRKEFSLPITGGFYPPFIIVGALTIAMIALLVYNFGFNGRRKGRKKSKSSKNVPTNQSHTQEKR